MLSWVRKQRLLLLRQTATIQTAATHCGAPTWCCTCGEQQCCCGRVCGAQRQKVKVPHLQGTEQTAVLFILLLITQMLLLHKGHL